MKRVIECIVFFPALISWLIFAPSFRLGNRIFPNSKNALWYWFGVEAKDHENYYETYGNEE